MQKLSKYLNFSVSRSRGSHQYQNVNYMCLSWSVLLSRADVGHVLVVVTGQRGPKTVENLSQHCINQPETTALIMVHALPYSVSTCPPFRVAGYWEAYMTPFLMPLTQVTLAGSCYTTVALTVERYISGMPHCRITRFATYIRRIF